ncbi:MAG: aspartate aminotransferase family protein [Desulfovibrionaceae bacterium]|nr:aspartate aminotransferase family protein [Desulfovibrionaceae bacterium]
MSDSFNALKAREEKLLCRTYGRYPLAVARAEGCRLFDPEGREYVDLLAGIAVAGLGHCRPELAEVMAEQARRLVHVSNLFYQAEQLDLAERLLSTCHLGKVFFCNSGAEANESAIKLARRYMRKVKGREAFEIVTLEGSFHGRTLATLTATGQTAKIKDGFGPLPEGFVILPFGDLEAMDRAVGDKTAAVMVEMIQGEGGVRPLPPGYVQALAQLCRDRDVLLVADEVQTGLCRTGKFWAHQHFGIKPDILTSAKGLANGLPMGAMLATDEVARGFEPGSHATTFGGGALVSAVASRVIDILIREDLARRAAEMGRFAMGEARKLAEKHPDKISTVRGMGLMIGIELKFPGEEVWKALLSRGFVLNLTHERVLRLLPPLIIPKQDILAFMRALDEVLGG